MSIEINLEFVVELGNGFRFATWFGNRFGFRLEFEPSPLTTAFPESEHV